MKTSAAALSLNVAEAASLMRTHHILPHQWLSIRRCSFTATRLYLISNFSSLRFRACDLPLYPADGVQPEEQCF